MSSPSYPSGCCWQCSVSSPCHAADSGRSLNVNGVWNELKKRMTAMTEIVLILAYIHYKFCKKRRWLWFSSLYQQTLKAFPNIHFEWGRCSRMHHKLVLIVPILFDVQSDVDFRVEEFPIPVSNWQNWQSPKKHTTPLLFWHQHFPTRVADSPQRWALNPKINSDLSSGRC